MNLPSTLVKLAFNARDARVIAELAERYAPKSLRRPSAFRGAARRGVGGVAGETSLTPEMARRESGMLAKRLGSLLPEEPAKPLSRLLKGYQAEAAKAPGRGLKSPTIRVDPGAFEKLIRGDVNKAVTESGAPKSELLQPLSGRQSMMLDAVTRGHELDELHYTTHAPGLVTQVVPDEIHASPGVIYREHNRLMTMPRGYGGVKDYLTTFRGLGSENRLLFEHIDPRLSYGGGERLSRHAIKRLSDVADKKMVEDWSAPGFVKSRYGEAPKEASFFSTLLKLAQGPVIDLNTPRNLAMLARRRALENAPQKPVDWSKTPGYRQGPGTTQPVSQPAPQSAPMVQPAANVRREPAAAPAARPVIPAGINPGQFYWSSPEGKITPGTDQSDAAYQAFKSQGPWDRLKSRLAPMASHGESDTLHQAPFSAPSAPRPAMQQSPPPVETQEARAKPTKVL